jgi:hypothetical protein
MVQGFRPRLTAVIQPETARDKSPAIRLASWLGIDRLGIRRRDGRV